MTPYERVRARVTIDSSTGCWLWSGAQNSAGYGQIRTAGKLAYTHRVTYLAAHPEGVPEGMQLDHLCRVRRCCNPAHLEAVTSRENTRRGAAPSAIVSRTDRCTAGHDLTTAYVRPDGGGRQCRACRNRRDREKASA